MITEGLRAAVERPEQQGPEDGRGDGERKADRERGKPSDSPS